MSRSDLLGNYFWSNFLIFTLFFNWCILECFWLFFTVCDMYIICRCVYSFIKAMANVLTSVISFCLFFDCTRTNYFMWNIRNTEEESSLLGYSGSFPPVQPTRLLQDLVTGPTPPRRPPFTTQENGHGRSSSGGYGDGGNNGGGGGYRGAAGNQNNNKRHNNNHHDGGAGSNVNHGGRAQYQWQGSHFNYTELF